MSSIANVSTIPQKPMSRWQAAGIHLGISAVIASLVMGVLFLVWYPSTYFTAMGGEQLVYLIVGCDVVLGPLITLVIFKAGKKGLVFDLAVIGCIQAAALVYGILVAAEARPVYTVFVVDRFEVTAANAIDKEDLARVKDPRYLSLPWTGPKTVAALKPTNADDQLQMIISGMGGKDMHTYPHLVVPYESVQEDAGRRAQPLSALRRLNPDRKDVVDAFLRKHNLKEDDVGFLPLKAKRDARAVILNKKGDILAILELSPW
jgi:hypothetical protein